MKQSLFNVGRWLLLPLVVLAPLADSVAQAYPAKIIRVINPNQPGGNSDVMFRLLAPKMGEILGQSLVIDYRPGGRWQHRCRDSGEEPARWLYDDDCLIELLDESGAVENAAL